MLRCFRFLVVVGAFTVTAVFPSPGARLQTTQTNNESWAPLTEAADKAYKERNFRYALQMYLAAIKDIEGQYGKHDARLVKPLVKLSSVYVPRGFLAPVIFADEIVLAPDAYRFAHFGVGVTMGGKGTPAKSQADRPVYLPAGEFLRRALRISEQAGGPESLEVAEVLEALGAHYLSINDWNKAEESFQRMLSIREKLFGPDSAELVRDLNTLAFVSRHRRKSSEALAFAQRAVALIEAHGVSTARIGSASRYLLARSLMDTKDFAAAEVLLAHCVAAHEHEVDGGRVIYLDFLLSEHASILRRLGRNEEATRQEERAAKFRGAIITRRN